VIGSGGDRGVLGVISLAVLLDLHRPPVSERPTAQQRAEPEYDTVSAFLRRWLLPLNEVFPSLTINDMRAHSLRDLASLILARRERIEAARQARSPDLHEELFGEVT
jgi:hypothetical protein